MLPELELRLRGNDQELLCALGNIGCPGETPDKESFSRVAKFTKSTARFWKPSRKLREFSSCARIRLHDCFRNQLETMHENDPFDTFPGFSNVVYMSLQCYLLHRVLQNDHSVRCAD